MYTVLYVDDDKHLLEVTRFFLEHTGEVKVDTAPLATEALKLPGFALYDAIVADYEMPRMDGIAFLKKVRADYGNIPFILFTGKGREAIVIEAINNGADFYLQKGGDPSSQFAELSHKIRKAVDKRRAEDTLSESEETFRSLVEESADGILLVDETGKVIEWNPALAEILGISRTEAVGKRYIDLLERTLIPEHRDPERIARLRTEMDTMLATGTSTLLSRRLEVEICRPDGTRRTIQQTVFPVRTSRGFRIGSISRDITERK
jgi:PAS domain S-box-containing protein